MGNYVRWITTQEKSIYHTDDPGFTFYKHRFAVRSLIVTEKVFIRQIVLPVSEALPVTPFYIFGYGAGFFFGKAGHQGDEELTFAVQGIDVLFFKIYGDTGDLQFADRIQGIDSVTGEAGEGLCYDQIDVTGQGIRDHTIESLPAIQ